jgi:hypothetical protein
VGTAAIGNVTFDAVNKLITVVMNNPHELHDGATVLLASEDAVAPGLNGGVATVDNMFSYGPVTVVGGRRSRCRTGRPWPARSTTTRAPCSRA